MSAAPPKADLHSLCCHGGHPSCWQVSQPHSPRTRMLQAWWKPLPRKRHAACKYSAIEVRPLASPRGSSRRSESAVTSSTYSLPAGRPLVRCQQPCLSPVRLRRPFSDERTGPRLGHNSSMQLFARHIEMFCLKFFKDFEIIQCEYSGSCDGAARSYKAVEFGREIQPFQPSADFQSAEDAKGVQCEERELGKHHFYRFTVPSKRWN